MQIIHKLETASPKVSTKQFPEVKFNPKRLQLRKVCASKSEHKMKPRVKDVFRHEEQLEEENLKFMNTLLSTRAKI